MNNADLGLVGLAVMGQNLALNAEGKGYSVVVYNRTTSTTDEFIAGAASDKQIAGATSVADLVEALSRPRKILLMVKAGPPVDAVLEQLLPLLDSGDVVMDGGNSHFPDTDRRGAQAEERGVLYLGTGISGGEYGALHGPSIMPGGHRNAYDVAGDLLEDVAAYTEHGPCCTYLGPGSAGHYVKMVHNGIEYAIMETLAEAYDLMKRALGMDAGEMAETVAQWNQAGLESYLTQITKDILRFEDNETGGPLVESILDEAKQKGTGKWSTQSALDLGSPAPSIAAAVFARGVSALKEERVAAKQEMPGPVSRYSGDPQVIIGELFGAVYLSVITAYAQGLRQLGDASQELDYGLDLGEVARIWMDGCIIRSDLLAPIRSAYVEHPDLTMLLRVEPFLSAWKEHQGSLRRVVLVAHELGIPVPVLDATLDFVDAYRTGRLPANLLQAQRDYFGAHTYRRVDRDGSFHTEWS